MSSTDSIAEEWRDIPGYEGIYQASSLGRIKSLHHGRERILSPHIDSTTGYRTTSLSRDGTTKRHLVHRAVALSFLDNPDGLPVVRHLDGDQLNNRLENLTWGTVAENNRDTVRHGHNPWSQRTHCIRGHEFTPENTYRYGRGRSCKTCHNMRRYGPVAPVARIGAKVLEGVA